MRFPIFQTRFMPDSSIQSLLARLRLQVHAYNRLGFLLAVIDGDPAAGVLDWRFLVDYPPFGSAASEMPRFGPDPFV